MSAAPRTIITNWDGQPRTCVVIVQKYEQYIKSAATRMPKNRRQIIIIDSAFPIKSDARFGSQIRQVEKVDSEQGFRFWQFF